MEGDVWELFGVLAMCAKLFYVCQLFEVVPTSPAPPAPWVRVITWHLLDLFKNNFLEVKF